MTNTSLPIGTIAEKHNFSYGYDGKKYYVTEGCLRHLVTRIHLTFDEAKQLFDALCFNFPNNPNSKEISALIRQSRKEKLEGYDLFGLLTCYNLSEWRRQMNESILLKKQEQIAEMLKGFSKLTNDLIMSNSNKS